MTMRSVTKTINMIPMINSLDQYISWIANGEQKWTINAGGTAADTRVEISARPIPQEPMVSNAYHSQDK